MHRRPEVRGILHRRVDAGQPPVEWLPLEPVGQPPGRGGATGVGIDDRLKLLNQRLERHRVQEAGQQEVSFLAESGDLVL